jgi:hypothetical protein
MVPQNQAYLGHLIPLAMQGQTGLSGAQQNQAVMAMQQQQQHHPQFYGGFPPNGAMDSSGRSGHNEDEGEQYNNS